MIRITCAIALMLWNIWLAGSCWAAGWWNKNWNYRFAVTVETGDFSCADRVAEVAVDFAEKFQEAGCSAKQLLIPSIRVIEVNAAGKQIAERLCQFDDGKLLWLLAGQTPPHSKRHFQVYFNASDAPVPSSSLPPLVVKADTLGRWRFTTPGGYYVYEKKGGAFEVFSPIPCQDNESGKDWQRDDYNRWNGILNVGDPNTHAIFHPNDDAEADDGIWKGCLSVQLYAGPLCYRIKAVNRFADMGKDLRSNTLYEIWYDIMPYGIRAGLVHGNEAGFACIMECTPGGDKLESDDYVVAGNGERSNYGEKWARDISPEWFYIGDAQSQQQLYFIHAEDDTVQDGLHWYDNMQAVMVGWGRGANPGIRTFPSTFYLGFTEAVDYPQMKQQVAGILTPLTFAVAKAEARHPHDWGSITIDKDKEKVGVTLENEWLRCVYDTVQSADVKTCMREFTLKKNKINQFSRLFKDMPLASPIERGRLTNGTRILCDGPDRKSVRLEWDDGRIVQEVTIYPDKPCVRIEHLKSGEKDQAGDSGFFLTAARPEFFEPTSNLVDHSNHHAETDNKSIQLTYRGCYITGCYHPQNGHGYGQVLKMKNDQAGPWPAFNKKNVSPEMLGEKTRLPVTEYRFAVSKGEKELIEQGKKWADHLHDEPWFRIDLSNRTFENQLLRIGHGPDLRVQGLRMNGIDQFVYKPGAENFATVLDAYGSGYAKYACGGPALFKLTHLDADFLEVTMQAGDGVKVVKRERLFNDLPLLEIQYDSLSLLWFEDFYAINHTKDRLYAINGLNTDIDSSLQASLRMQAEDRCGHNFGDCFLKSCGVTVEQCVYKGYFIFGFYNSRDHRGLGFVMPVNIGLHGGFKLWSMFNYESFPFSKMEKILPLRRWIFVTTTGREGILSIGREIADIAASGQGLQQHLPALRKVCHL